MGISQAIIINLCALALFFALIRGVSRATTALYYQFLHRKSAENFFLREQAKVSINSSDRAKTLESRLGCEDFLPKSSDFAESNACQMQTDNSNTIDSFYTKGDRGKLQEVANSFPLSPFKTPNPLPSCATTRVSALRSFIDFTAKKDMPFSPRALDSLDSANPSLRGEAEAIYKIQTIESANFAQKTQTTNKETARSAALPPFAEKKKRRLYSFRGRGELEGGIPLFFLRKKDLNNKKVGISDSVWQNLNNAFRKNMDCHALQTTLAMTETLGEKGISFFAVDSNGKRVARTLKASSGWGITKETAATPCFAKGEEERTSRLLAVASAKHEAKFKPLPLSQKEKSKNLEARKATISDSVRQILNKIFRKKDTSVASLPQYDEKSVDSVDCHETRCVSRNDKIINALQDRR